MQATPANGPVSKTFLVHTRSLLSLFILNPRATGRVELSSGNKLCEKGSCVQ